MTEAGQAAAPWQLSAGTVLARTIGLWARNFVPYSVLSLLAISPLVVYAALAEPEPRTVWAYGLIVTLGPSVLHQVAAAAIVWRVFRQLRGLPAPLGESLSVTFSRVMTVVTLAIVVTLLIAANLVLFVVPGLIVITIFFVALPAAVLERADTRRALERSATLTSGSRLVIFVIWLVPFVVQVLSGFAISLAFPDPGAPPQPSVCCCLLMSEIYAAQQSQTIAGMILGAVLNGLTAIASVVVYHDLRMAKEADPEAVTRIFA